jgi:hypothetical protein
MMLEMISGSAADVSSRSYQFSSNSPMDLFDRLRQQDGWQYSHLTPGISILVLDSNATLLPGIVPSTSVGDDRSPLATP